jgi:hypothetical protein
MATRFAAPCGPLAPPLTAIDLQVLRRILKPRVYANAISAMAIFVFKKKIIGGSHVPRFFNAGVGWSTCDSTLVTDYFLEAA